MIAALPVASCLTGDGYMRLIVISAVALATAMLAVESFALRPMPVCYASWLGEPVTESVAQRLYQA